MIHWLLLSVFAGLAVPLLGNKAGLNPLLSLVVLPMLFAVLVFLTARRAFPPPGNQILPFILSAVVLQVPMVALLISPLWNPFGVFSWIADFIKFVIASAVLGFAFLLLFSLRSLGKPGAFLSVIASVALSSAIVFKKVSPLGGQWEVSPEEILLFILLSSLFLMAIALVGWERG